MGQETADRRGRPSKLIEDGDTVLLDGGSTTYEVARLLVGRPLQIVTNSLPVANLFASNANNDLVLLGGYVYPRTGVALGPYANEMLAAAQRAPHDPQRRRHQRPRVLQQQPAAGRNRAGHDARRRRSDRRGRQHEVRPSKPGASVPAWTKSNTWSSTTRSSAELAQEAQGRGRQAARCRRARQVDEGQNASLRQRTTLMSSSATLDRTTIERIVREIVHRHAGRHRHAAAARPAGAGRQHFRPASAPDRRARRDPVRPGPQADDR